jgi:hypothetical protein
LPPNPGSQGIEIEAYPNPASGNVNIRLGGYTGGQVQYKVFDVNGRLITQGNSSQALFSITTDKLEDAIYELQINDNTGVLGTKRLVVIR